MNIEQTFFTALRFNFLYVDYYEFKKTWVYPESYIPYSMLRYVVRGSGIFVIDGQEYEVTENKVCYIPEGCRLSCYATGNELVFFSIRFTTTVRINDKDLLTDFYHLQPVLEDTDRVIQQRFQEIYSYAKGDSIARLFHIRGNLELLIAWVVEHAHTHSVRDGDAETGATEALPERTPEWTWDPSLEASCERAKKSNRIKRDFRIEMVVD